MQRSAWQWQPQSVSDLLDNTFRVFTARFGVLFGLSALVLIPVALVQLLLIPELPGLTPFDLMGEMTPDQAELLMAELFISYDWGRYAVGAFVASLFSIFAYSLLNGAITSVVQQHMHGGAATFVDALRRGAQFIWRVTGSRLLLALVMMVVLFVCLMMSGLAAVFLHPAVSALLLIAGLVVASIQIGIRWLLAVPAIVVEQTGVIAGIGRSFALARGAVAAMLGRYLLFSVLWLVLHGVATFVIGAAAGLALFWTSEWVIAVISGLGGALVSAVFQPLLPIMLTLLYFDRRVRQEGYDLERLAEQLDGDT